MYSSGGKGIKRYNGESFESLIDLYSNGFILEPCLKNERNFREFHEPSLNTVRVGTVHLNDRTEIPFAFVRFGKDGNCIDNARAGGIMGLVDVDSGVIVAACDEDRNHFVFHPNSHKQIIGFGIPMWEEAKKLVRQLAEIVPENRYTGWDIALTEDGWVLIEANCKGQFVAQIPLKEGFRDKFDSYLKDLGLE